MDLCRILVATSEGSSCPGIVPVEVGKESFRIKVHEVCDVPSDEWLWEQLGLGQIYFSVASKMVNSPVKSPNWKLVVFEKNDRSRFRDTDKSVEKGGMSESFIGVENRECLGFNYGDVSPSKGKSAIINDKKAAPSSRTLGQLKLSSGKNKSHCQLLDFSSKNNLDCLSTDEDSLSSHDDRPDPSKRIGEKELIGVVDLIANCLVAKSPLGQSSLNSYELYVDLGSGIKVCNPSSIGKERMGAGEQMRISNVRGASGRGRRNVVSSARHRMRTRRSSKRSAPIETGGSEMELDAEFARVIKESISRG
ncbi:hypothetical protein LWI29_011813 [Acer saccharum]|uniref:Uncharacterized protein n=1 Tax=Acer saccharum TaxID=4024 RepID=A0AA39RQ00_ACESA|nr:hypothetical protein LWI29_011813 [Acer saccharum]